MEMKGARQLNLVNACFRNFRHNGRVVESDDSSTDFAPFKFKDSLKLLFHQKHHGVFIWYVFMPSDT